jgi:predicted DNA-binding protein with PD1-like motif
MRYQRFGYRLQVRLESGDEVMSSLVRLAEKEGIGFAALSGLGAVRSITLAYYNTESKAYEKHDLDEQMEVTSLIGNVSQKDGQPFAHVHVTLGRRDLSVIGGHVFRAIAHSTLEVWLSSDEAVVERLPDEESGLSLLALSESG